MSLAQILGHLRTGDIIMVRGGDASFRLRLPSVLDRVDAVDDNTNESRELLRSLITVRRDGGKK
jgi:hypothetical protein